MPFLTETFYRGHLHRTPVSPDRRILMESRILSQIAVPTPSHGEIARLAYSYWEARGRQHGSALEDWLRAEREVWKLYQS